MMKPCMLCLFTNLLRMCTAVCADEQAVFSAERGTWQYRVASPHAVGTNLVEVLLPKSYDPAKKYRVLYVLPVEAGENHRFGDGMKVIRDLDAHNRYDLIVVAPTFDIDPWYGNHASDPQRHQEDYLLKTVIPLVGKNYSTLGTAYGLLLIGFSKSGWGALTLILRHPDVFGYAASWDAPLMFTEKQFGIWKTNEVFGTAENMSRYLPTTLLREHASKFKDKTRLVLAGKNLFGTFTDKRFPYDGPSHTEAFHELAESLAVRHLYAPDIKANHSWNPNWVKPVLAMLVSLADKPQEK